MWPYYEIAFAQTIISFEKLDLINIRDFLDINGTHNHGQRTRFRGRSGQIVDLRCCIVTTNHTNTYACEMITTQYDEGQSFRKIYLSLYLKGLCVRGSWRPNRTATYWSPLLWPSAFLSRSLGLLNRGPSGLASLGAGFLCRILSPTDWISCALSYITVHAHSISPHNWPSE